MIRTATNRQPRRQARKTTRLARWHAGKQKAAEARRQQRDDNNARRAKCDQCRTPFKPTVLRARVRRQPHRCMVCGTAYQGNGAQA